MVSQSGAIPGSLLVFWKEGEKNPPPKASPTSGKTSVSKRSLNDGKKAKCTLTGNIRLGSEHLGKSPARRG